MITADPEILFNKLPSLTGHAGYGGVLLGTLGSVELNLSGYPFPGWSTPDSRRAVAEALLPTLLKMRRRHWALCAEMSALTARQRYLLMERGQITAPMAARQDGVYVLINEDQDTECFINDEEHLLIQTFYPGPEGAARALAEMKKLRASLEKKLTLAWDPSFGYLSGDPSKSGEALYFSHLVHLPALNMSQHLPRIAHALEDMDIFCSPIFSGLNEEECDLFLIHSPAAPINKLHEAMARVDRVLADLTKQELNARANLLLKQADKVQSTIRQAYSTLTSAEALKYREMIVALSLLLLGLHYGFLRTEHPEAQALISRAYIDAAPAHLRFRGGCTTAQSVKSARAEYTRHLLCDTLRITPHFS